MAKQEFFLHWWGGCSPTVKAKYGFDHEMYFDSEGKRDDAIAKIREIGVREGWAFSVKDGEMSHQRPVAKVSLKYNDIEYQITDDSYSQEYDESLLDFMWKDGNYACDCNRSQFLREAGHDVPDMECGDLIELTNLEVEHVAGPRRRDDDA